MLGVRVIIPILALIPAFVLRRKKYEFSWLQMIVAFIVSIVVGALSSMLASTGVRQYGPVLVDSIVFLPLALIFKKKAFEVYDYLSIVAAVAMWTGKIPCLIDGCCEGIMLTDTIQYPSQIVEFTVLMVICLTLVCLERKGKCKNILWPSFMAMFGVHRFLANLMRGNSAETQAIFIGLAEAEIASLVIAAIGVAWIVLYSRKNNQKSKKITDEET